ncbi:type II toxin-antitoxin system HipA family toxin [Microbacterium sp.]|uniref:type II toxin-antitoxin system HipA family toxin n=1 Tax=Microbacterium sp. TaxID=51671 RepID=UPI003A8F0302
MRLTTYVDGMRVGWFEQTDSGAITLDYDQRWQNTSGRRELSWSLPKSRRHHRGDGPGNYLWNLLPDNDDVLQRWARRFGVSPRNPLALLANVGLDAAGAVQLVSSDEWDETELSGEGGMRQVDDAEIAGHLRELQRDPSAWVDPAYDGGYFSLAGAQAKFTLARTSRGWAVPLGRTPSTHIVKPGIIGLARSALNEHLTMRAARDLGLRVAGSDVVRFDDQAAIVVERFDRVRTADGVMVRRHQEDFAQASGTHPSRKYQSDGGPGIASVGTLLRQHLGKTADDEVARFFEATLFNWAALGTDAHAKNHALMYPRAPLGRPTLAPLYDVGSALAYPEINNRRARLAMSYAGHYRTFEIEPRHIVREGVGVGLPEEWVLDRARHIVGGLTDALRRAVADAALVGDDAVFAATLVERAHERTGMLGRQLAGRL